MKRPTKEEIKELILRGNRLKIASAILQRWDLKNRKIAWLPYRED